MGYVEQMLSGLHGRNHNRILCQIVEAGLYHMPEEPLLGMLCAEVGDRIDKRGDTVYKALTRAVRDTWEHGDRHELERLMGYRVLEEPSAKEMVMALISTLWERSTQVEYQLQEGGLDHKVGIACRSVNLENGSVEHAVMAPFSRDREAVMELIQRWNREQLPLQQFRDMILLGQLRER